MNNILKKRFKKSYILLPMTWSIQNILIQIKSRQMKSPTKILLFISWDAWRSETLATQQLIA